MWLRCAGGGRVWSTRWQRSGMHGEGLGKAQAAWGPRSLRTTKSRGGVRERKRGAGGEAGGCEAVTARSGRGPTEG